MKAQEKELIYNLLKKASDNFYGYSSPEFLNESVIFQMMKNKQKSPIIK